MSGSSPTPPAVSIVVVTWNNRDIIGRCLDTVLDAGVSMEICVVDNASPDGTADFVASHYPSVTLLRNSENRGFAAANNRGITCARGRFVLILNPDAFLHKGTLEFLVHYLDAHNDVAVVGPQLLNEDGSVQSSRRRAPTRWTGFYESTQLQQWFGENALTRRYYVSDRSAHEVQDVDWITGACMLVRAAAIAQVGGFDPRFHMYSEELEWCLRFKRQGWRVVYIPDVQVTHLVGHSSGQDILHRHWNHNWSKLRLYALLYGRPWATVLRVWLSTLYALQCLEELGKYLLIQRNRAMRRQRLSVLWAMVSGLITGKLGDVS
ncbi:MAG: glycosyltransferase family 2 protein [Chloroflexi bacterium]|nr:glycosyltransferase family 2 protein [Chloroflexota bacterium]